MDLASYLLPRAFMSESTLVLVAASIARRQFVMVRGRKVPVVSVEVLVNTGVVCVVRGEDLC